MPMFGLMELVMLSVAIALPIWTLFKIRDSGLSGVEAIVWVLIVILVPLLGPLAFLIVRPGAEAH